MAGFHPDEATLLRSLSAAQTRLSWYRDRWPHGALVDRAAATVLDLGSEDAVLQSFVALCALLSFELRAEGLHLDFRRGQAIEAFGRRVAASTPPRCEGCDDRTRPPSRWAPRDLIEADADPRHRWTYYVAALALAEVAFIGPNDPDVEAAEDGRVPGFGELRCDPGAPGDLRTLWRALSNTSSASAEAKDFRPHPAIQICRFILAAREAAGSARPNDLERAALMLRGLGVETKRLLDAGSRRYARVLLQGLAEGRDAFRACRRDLLRIVALLGLNPGGGPPAPGRPEGEQMRAELSGAFAAHALCERVNGMCLSLGRLPSRSEAAGLVEPHLNARLAVLSASDRVRFRQSYRDELGVLRRAAKAGRDPIVSLVEAVSEAPLAPVRPRRGPAVAAALLIGLLGGWALAQLVESDPPAPAETPSSPGPSSGESGTATARHQSHPPRPVVAVPGVDEPDAEAPRDTPTPDTEREDRAPRRPAPTRVATSMPLEEELARTRRARGYELEDVGRRLSNELGGLRGTLCLTDRDETGFIADYVSAAGALGVTLIRETADLADLPERLRDHRCDLAFIPSGTLALVPYIESLSAPGTLRSYDELEWALGYDGPDLVVGRLRTRDYEILGVVPAGTGRIAASRAGERSDVAPGLSEAFGDALTAELGRNLGADGDDGVTGTYLVFPSASARALLETEAAEAVSAPLAYHTMQLVAAHDRFPVVFEWWSRTYALSRFAPARRHVESGAAALLKGLDPSFPKPSGKRLFEVRHALRKAGLYSRDGLDRTLWIRCRVNPASPDCRRGD